MIEAHEEVLMRITAQMVSEQEDGQRPRVGEYIRRYPQYAHEIADFATYYYAMEMNLPSTTAAFTQLSASSLTALDRAWKQLEDLGLSEAMPLLQFVQQRSLSFSGLAAALDLSQDVVEQLVHGQLDPVSLPRALLQRLADVLALSLPVLRRALGLLEQVVQFHIAEETAAYAPGARPSFRQAMEASEQLSASLKEQWLAILECERR